MIKSSRFSQVQKSLNCSYPVTYFVTRYLCTNIARIEKNFRTHIEKCCFVIMTIYITVPKEKDISQLIEKRWLTIN